MRKRLLILLISFSGINLNAQTNLDSLYTVWQDQSQTDSIRVKAYTKYILKGFLYSNPDSAIHLAQELLNYGEKHQYPMANAKAKQIIGYSYQLKYDFPKAINYLLSSLKIYQEIGNKKSTAACNLTIGNLYSQHGFSSKALEYKQRSLKVFEEIGEKNGMASAINNIGNVYRNQGDIPNALKYFQRSLKIFEEIGSKENMANALANIGSIYSNQANFPKALEYSQLSLKVFEEIGNKKSVPIIVSNIGSTYYAQGDYPKALDYFQRSLKMNEEIGDKRSISVTLSGIGTIYQKQGIYPKALKYCQMAMSISEDFGLLPQQKTACKCLYDTYKSMGKGNEALVYIEKMNVLDDSLNAKEVNKKLQQMQFQEEMLKDSIANAEETRKVEEAHQEEVRQGEKIRNILVGIGVLILILAGGLYGRVRYIRKSKAILQTEKDRSENLLLNILPADIAAELKEKGRADARDFDLVSILFTDFKDFTETSAKLSAQDLVSEINTCFEAFDGIMAKYGVEKIKTIGDAYMAAGGLPVPTDDSIKNTVLAALEMQAFITKRKTELDAIGKPAFEMRVGIHTGPVVAGIVGVKKFQYDIWGDTVNTASRMEGLGASGQVNVSQSTYELLKGEADFRFENRGKIEAKGKGEMEMYFVSKA